MSLVKIIR
nr:unnamed protein product [Callosobruchus analis]CAI5848471.1 unnamed protein product [Callosobruchus analis]